MFINTFTLYVKTGEEDLLYVICWNGGRRFVYMIYDLSRKKFCFLEWFEDGVDMRFWNSCSSDASTVLGVCNSEGRFDLDPLIKNEEEVVFYFYFLLLCGCVLCTVYACFRIWGVGFGVEGCVVCGRTVQV